jgi:acyl-CoA hydrolase/RimJ/RimL family protein N-acetyltransferase
MPFSVTDTIQRLRERYPEKFQPEEKVFAQVPRGAKIFVATACGEPRFLVKALTEYVKANPKAIYGAELMQVWTLGVAPYTEPVFKDNFRYNSFFIGENTRGAINEGLADYSPVFLSRVPELFKRGHVEVDVALIQVSPPDAQGYVNLGVSVDIVKAAVESAKLVIAQINQHVPRIHGDGFLSPEQIGIFVEHDEPLLTVTAEIKPELVEQLGRYVARLVKDGDTLQVGYGATPNAVLSALTGKKHLGVHTELLGDGIVDLMKRKVIDNSQKTVNQGIAVGSFSMGGQDTYAYLHDNPQVQFRTIDFTNDVLTIARQKNMVAINSALAIDLTGQATAESLGDRFYSGIGGQADFMRGAVLAPGGRSILTFPSTADGGKVSRIVPALPEGSGATLNRGDVHYVVTEYGIAYLHGKNIRERAMALISIAHPDFRSELIREAKKRNLIYRDQAFVPGKRGEYPDHLETYRTTKSGRAVFLRPVKISDEPIVKDFFYDLSHESLYRRFISMRRDIPHERLQDFTVIDYTREMVILAVEKNEEIETLIGIGQYASDDLSHTAEVAFVVADDQQNQGIGTAMMDYLTFLAKRQGLLGFTAEVLADNEPILHLLEKAGYDVWQPHRGDDVYMAKRTFES